MAYASSPQTILCAEEEEEEDILYIYMCVRSGSSFFCEEFVTMLSQLTIFN